MPSPLEVDADLAAALGRVVGAWSHIEFKLTLIFSALAEVEPHLGAGIFDFFKSTSTQNDVLRRMATLSPRSTPTLRAQLKSAMAEYVRLAPRRNEVAHSPFGWDDEETDAIYLMQKTKGMPSEQGIPWSKRPVSINELDALRNEIEMLNLMLVGIIITMPPPTFYPTPLPQSPGSALAEDPQDARPPPPK